MALDDFIFKLAAARESKVAAAARKLATAAMTAAWEVTTSDSGRGAGGAPVRHGRWQYSAIKMPIRLETRWLL